jgi:hypothetical protein
VITVYMQYIYGGLLWYYGIYSLLFITVGLFILCYLQQYMEGYFYLPIHCPGISSGGVHSLGAVVRKAGYLMGFIVRSVHIWRVLLLGIYVEGYIVIVCGGYIVTSVYI